MVVTLHYSQAIGSTHHGPRRAAGAGGKLHRRIGRQREHCAAFLGVYCVIWGPQMEANALERDDVRSTYRRKAAILSVLWFIYPIILAVAPDGLNIVSNAFSVLVIAILDVVAKVAHGLMAVASDSKATDRDLAELDRPASLHAAA